MSKTFKKVSPILYREVLQTAEKVIMLNNPDEKNPVLNDLYMLIHPFAGKCDNPHWEWRTFAEEMKNKLVDF